MEKRQVGEMIVTDRGIERVIETGDLGSYTTELIISKEVFQEAYEKYIESKTEELDMTVTEFVEDLPPVNPQVKTDTWSIKDVADAFEKHGLIKEQEPCDTVSREAVKEQMIKYGFHSPDMTVTEFVEDL